MAAPHTGTSSWIAFGGTTALGTVWRHLAVRERVPDSALARRSSQLQGLHALDVVVAVVGHRVSAPSPH